MGQYRLLVADDEDALRELLREALGSPEYVIEEAADGAEAIAMLGQTRYDLAILDINMPKKTGLDVLRLIREKGFAMKVIMLTGRLGFSVGSESMLLGADEYITKPFDIEFLQDTIRRLLTEGREQSA